MTLHESVLTLSLLKLITVILGFVIVYLAWKAFRASRRRPLLWLTVGLAVMTLGVISEGAAFRGLGWTLGQSHLFEGVVTLIAFAILVYSLYS